MCRKLHKERWGDETTTISRLRYKKKLSYMIQQLPLLLLASDFDAAKALSPRDPTNRHCNWRLHRIFMSLHRYLVVLPDKKQRLLLYSTRRYCFMQIISVPLRQVPKLLCEARVDGAQFGPSDGWSMWSAIGSGAGGSSFL